MRKLTINEFVRVAEALGEVCGPGDDGGEVMGEFNLFVAPDFVTNPFLPSGCLYAINGMGCPDYVPVRVVVYKREA